MAHSFSRLFVYGFPGLYGGAATELHHQIVVWRHLGIEVHLIPSDEGYRNEVLYREMLRRGVWIHPCNAWEVLGCDDVIISFCSAAFLKFLPEIRLRTKRTVFVNCMTWLFEREKERFAQGMIAAFLYQNEEVRRAHRRELLAIKSDSTAAFLTFSPYFDNSQFQFVEKRSSAFFGCGRISRQDADKFSRNTLHIYDYFVSPVPKFGLFLGFDKRSEAKIGKVPGWIRVARDQTEVSQQEFYRHCEIILQPMDTTENWPRIAFEAMASGSVLIVDNRGGWRKIVEHGKTGFLCNNERDFIYYASRMAYEPNWRKEIAFAARERALALGGLEASANSWREVFDALEKLQN